MSAGILLAGFGLDFERAVFQLREASHSVIRAPGERHVVSDGLRQDSPSRGRWGENLIEHLN